MFCAGRGYHGRFLLFQKISSSTSYFNDLLQGCRAVVFISTFPVSVTVPTASVVVCGGFIWWYAPFSAPCVFEEIIPVAILKVIAKSIENQNCLANSRILLASSED